MKNTVNILGTEYKIEIHKCDEDSYLKDNQFAGYCCEDIPLIVIQILMTRNILCLQMMQTKIIISRELLGMKLYMHFYL